MTLTYTTHGETLPWSLLNQWHWPWNSPLTPAQQQQQQAISLILFGIFFILFILISFTVKHYFKHPSSFSSSSSTSSSSAINIALTGATSAGKTRVWSRLIFERHMESVPSLMENIGMMTMKRTATLAKHVKQSKSSVRSDRVFRIIDTLGQVRLRGKSLATYLPSAHGIVFVVPCTSLSGPALRETGEYLHLLLSQLALISHHSSTSKSLPPLLILVTIPPSLTDSTTTRTAPPFSVLNRAQSSLIRELSRRRSLLAPLSNSTSSTQKSPSLQHQNKLQAATLQGIGPIPDPSVSDSESAWWWRWWSMTARMTDIHSSQLHDTVLPLDEGEVVAQVSQLGLNHVDLDGHGAWQGGVRWIVWKVSDPAGDEEGLREIWDWIRHI